MSDERETSVDAKTAGLRNARDHDDLNHELAGLEVGRQKRFLPEGAGPASFAERQKKAERDASDALHILLNDPGYAALHARVLAKLDHAQIRVAELLAEAEDRLSQTAAELETIRARAGTLPDGTRVYRSSDGAVFTEDGAEIALEDQADIAWSADPPSWEAYQSAEAAHQAAAAHVGKIVDFQTTVLDPAADRINDGRNPLMTDELEEIETGIENGLPELERQNAAWVNATPPPTRLEAFNDLSLPAEIASTSQHNIAPHTPI